MEKRIRQSSIASENTMYVWKYGQYNRSETATHLLKVDVDYYKDIDCYRVIIRQEPYGSKKGIKIIEFVVERKDLDGLLAIAKIKGGMSYEN